MYIPFLMFILYDWQNKTTIGTSGNSSNKIKANELYKHAKTKQNMLTKSNGHAIEQSQETYPMEAAMSLRLFCKTTKSSSNGVLKSSRPLLNKYISAPYNLCSRHKRTTYSIDRNYYRLHKIKITTCVKP